MEFEFDVVRAVGSSSPVVDGSGTGSTPMSTSLVDDAALGRPRWGQLLRDMLDAVGERSRRAQGLSKAVTCGQGALSPNRVYILSSGRSVLGLLKVGPKRLFVAKGNTNGLHEITPLCVLDFYVVEGHQRAGLGRKIFDAMLVHEGVSPEKLAYDSPSPKLLSFMKSHFGLAKFHPQSNHFVVYDAYFAPTGSALPRPLAAAAAGREAAESFARPADPALAEERALQALLEGAELARHDGAGSRRPPGAAPEAHGLGKPPSRPAGLPTRPRDNQAPTRAVGLPRQRASSRSASPLCRAGTSAVAARGPSMR